LFGHSRGGLAARAYLQSDQTMNKEFIKGFATTGTPHQGSPLGRFYKYMAENCIPQSSYENDNSKCEDNWEVIKMLNGTRTYFGFSFGDYQMDLQAPSIDYLSPDSQAIISLNETISKVENLITGALTYEGTKFGVLGKDVFLSFDYDLYQYQNGIGDHPSPDTLTFIQNNQSRELLIGDGIVPSYSQNLSLLLENDGLTINRQRTTTTTNILHTEETSQISDISWLFEGLYTDLGWK